jgi:hypothetical protein
VASGFAYLRDKDAWSVGFVEENDAKETDDGTCDSL